MIQWSDQEEGYCEGIFKSAFFRDDEGSDELNGDEEFELPELENALDILQYCWFTGIYVNMLSTEDPVAFVAEGEGDWGSVIGFAVQNNEVVYVGTEYMDCMRAE